jgi:hypothetical protein
MGVSQALRLYSRSMISCNAPECGCYDGVIDPTTGTYATCPHMVQQHADYSDQPPVVAKVLSREFPTDVQRVLCLTCGDSLRGYFGTWEDVVSAVQTHRSQAHSEPNDSVARLCVSENQWVSYVRRA